MTFTLPMNPLLELLEDAHGSELVVRIHPSRWPAIVAATNAADRRDWTLNIRISHVFDPDVVTLARFGSIEPPVRFVNLRPSR